MENIELVVLKIPLLKLFEKKETFEKPDRWTEKLKPS